MHGFSMHDDDDNNDEHLFKSWECTVNFQGSTSNLVVSGNVSLIDLVGKRVQMCAVLPIVVFYSARLRHLTVHEHTHTHGSCNNVHMHNKMMLR